MVRTGGDREYYDNHRVPPKILQIKEEDKFFSRLLSKKESSNSKESSFRVLYYGGAAGAIPFTWESRPGTPKHTFSDTCSLPPLTPPPSYQMTPINSRPDYHKPNKLLQFLRTAALRKEKSSAESASFSSASFSSSYSLPSNSTSTPIRLNKSRVRRWSSSADQAVHFGLDVDEDQDEQTSISPTSTLCFRSGSRSRGRASSGSGSGSDSSGVSSFKMKNMKKKVLSFVGHS